jgi:uncharacterized coiled-coil protein SlyX
MTEPIENLILEHLKRFQVELASARDRDSEMLNRLGRLEIALAGLRRDVAHFDEGAAEQGLRMDRLAERVARIERRLELAD